MIAHATDVKNYKLLSRETKLDLLVDMITAPKTYFPTPAEKQDLRNLLETVINE